MTQQPPSGTSVWHPVDDHMHIGFFPWQVEMDKEVPAAEADSMADQIARLLEVDDLQAEWQAAAEASDEVERLLRAV